MRLLLIGFYTTNHTIQAPHHPYLTLSHSSTRLRLRGERSERGSICPIFKIDQPSDPYLTHTTTRSFLFSFLETKPIHLTEYPILPTLFEHQSSSYIDPLKECENLLSTCCLSHQIFRISNHLSGGPTVLAPKLLSAQSSQLSPFSICHYLQATEIRQSELSVAIDILDYHECRCIPSKSNLVARPGGATSHRLVFQ